MRGGEKLIKFLASYGNIIIFGLILFLLGILFLRLALKTEINTSDAKQNSELLSTTKALRQRFIKNVDCSVARCTALTFDDGPNQPTLKLLATLQKHNVKATFFVLGLQVDKHPDILKKVVQQKHALGNHSYDHKNFLRMPPEHTRHSLDRTSDAIYQAAGVRPAFARAPYGAITPQLAANLNIPFVQWNVDPNDWHTRSSQELCEVILEQARPGSVILSHDIYESTVEAYKCVIPELIKRGHTLVTIPQMFSFTDKIAPIIYYSN